MYSPKEVWETKATPSRIMVTFVAIILTQFLTVAAAGMVYLLLLLLFYVVLIGIFTIVPVTQYVYVNDTVTFECATNLNKKILYFEIAGENPLSQTSLALPNGGMMISFNLTATKALNGTDVTCYTFSGNATDTAYLYIQGKLVNIIDVNHYVCIFRSS